MALLKLGTEHVALAAAGERPGWLAVRRLCTHQTWTGPLPPVLGGDDPWNGTTQRPEHLVLPPATCGPAGRLGPWQKGCSGAVLEVPAAPGARQVEGPSASETHGGALSTLRLIRVLSMQQRVA